VNSLRLAFGLLTALPVGRLPSVDRRSAGAAMLLAPLTTAPLLALVAAAHAAVRLGAPALVAAGLLVTAGALLSRALHLDGLADTADGLSAGFDAETSLRAMKASDTGPSGVAAVVLALLLQVASLDALLGSAHGSALAALAWLGSRHSLAWACRRGVPAAQQTGLGALVAGTVGRGGLALAGGLVALVAMGLGALMAPQESVAAAGQGLVVVAVGLLAAEALLRRCRVRLGGVTGDVLGAGIEISLTASLVTAALLVTT
jgi:adenosylcobinamide-GDP ribazoletransferase